MSLLLACSLSLSMAMPRLLRRGKVSNESIIFLIWQRISGILKVRHEPVGKMWARITQPPKQSVVLNRPYIVWQLGDDKER